MAFVFWVLRQCSGLAAVLLTDIKVNSVDAVQSAFLIESDEEKAAVVIVADGIIALLPGWILRMIAGIGLAHVLVQNAHDGIGIRYSKGHEEALELNVAFLAEHLHHGGVSGRLSLNGKVEIIDADAFRQIRLDGKGSVWIHEGIEQAFRTGSGIGNLQGIVQAGALSGSILGIEFKEHILDAFFCKDGAGRLCTFIDLPGREAWIEHGNPACQRHQDSQDDSCNICLFHFVCSFPCGKLSLLSAG